LAANGAAISSKSSAVAEHRRYRGRTKQEENGMPVITGFDKLASVPEEQITEKIGRRVISGKQGTMVYWRMKAGAHAAAHQHPQESVLHGAALSWAPRPGLSGAATGCRGGA
jgi:hypothetical protein